MTVGGATEALTLQRPLVVASPSILAPDPCRGNLAPGWWLQFKEPPDRRGSRTATNESCTW